MTRHNRWSHEPQIESHGEEFIASSEAFPGVYGEGQTREEAIESFWEMVGMIGELARAPDWPHERTPYVDDWEALDGPAGPWGVDAVPEEGGNRSAGELPGRGEAAQEDGTP